MSQSPAGTSKRALARIQRLCCLGVGSEMLVPDLMREVMAFIQHRAEASFFRTKTRSKEQMPIHHVLNGILAELYLKEFYSTPPRERVAPATFRVRRPGPFRAPVLCGSSSSCVSIAVHFSQ